jgi:hypothetical protein
MTLHVPSKLERWGRSDNWHDTRMNDENMQMWKNPDLVLDYHQFWSQNHLFAAYAVPKAPEESIRQYEHGLRSCTPRIEGNRPRQMAEEIIRNNQVS